MTPTTTIVVDIPAQRADADRLGHGDGLATWPLVERAKAGDAEAFAELYRLHRNDVYRMALSRTGRDRAVAEDITSGTFMRAWRSIGRVEYQGRDFAALLMTIARNLIADHFKSAAVSRGTLIGFDDGTPEAGELMWTWAAPDPARQAERAELRRAVEAALAELTPAQARIMRLRYLEGWSTEETAALEGMTVGAVKAVAYRAVRAVRRSGVLDGHR